MSAGEPCVQRLLRAMTDPAVGRLVLYGLGGAGKTWAARRAADRAKESSLFDITIWVSLSARSTPRQVSEKIISSLPIPPPYGGADDGEGEDEDALRLWKARRRVYHALSGTKFLLILDDLWLTEDDVLGTIGIPDGDPAVGSKVLITTRSQRVLATTQPDLLIEMAGLPFRESLGLFQEAAGEAVAACSQSSTDVSSLVHEVICRCLGMPLAVALVGGALRGKADAPAIESALMAAASALGEGMACNCVAYRAARLGYHSLPSDAAKDFLRKCALFHQDRGVPAHELVRFGYSRGITGEMLHDDAYETVRAMLTDLLGRRLLCEDGDGRVVAQTVVREVLLDTVPEGEKMLWRIGPGVTSIPWGWEDKWRNYDTIALMDTTIEALPGSPRCPGLSTLLLNGNHLLMQIPESFFTHMWCLRVLDLSDTRIGHLPSSLGELFELRLLLLRRCVRLAEVANLTANLEVLDLSGATSMKKIAWGPSSQASPTLTVLNLSDTSVEELPFLVNLRNLRQLSLSGCRHLKAALHLSSLSKLELLDLSGTMLVEFPYGITELTQLKLLRLVGSKYTRVEWRMIHWLPEGLVWDQSSGSDITAEAAANGDGTTFISANDPGVFCNLDGDSPLWRNCFKKFHFSLCLGDAAGSDDVRFQRKEFVFRDAYFKTRHFVPCENRDRYLEIRGAHGFPYGIEGVLCNSELVALASVKFMKRLSDLGLQDMRRMKECWIERCDQMETVLDDQEAEFLGTQGSLECLWVSNLMSLRSLIGKTGGAAGSFACLKHLNLDCCPNVVCVFSSAVRLRNLETFQIKFCDELETVFGDPVSGEDAFPRLHSMRLWELPRLSNVADGALPALKNLKVKQCPMLTKIPVSASETSPLVRIIGEPWWWNNLKWDDQATKRHLLFRRWGRF